MSTFLVSMSIRINCLHQSDILSSWHVNIRRVTRPVRSCLMDHAVAVLTALMNSSSATSLAADGGLGWIWGPGLWWFPIAFEGLSGSARLRERGWWHWEGKGAPATANVAEGRRRPKLPEAEKAVVSEEFERGGCTLWLA